MKKKKKHFPLIEKLSILREYYSSGVSMYAMARKYEVNASTIRSWVLKYPIATESLSLPEETHDKAMKRKKSGLSDEVEKLQSRIKALEKALAFSRLETKARDMLIDLAEEQENIQIRKKPGAR